MRPPVKRQLKLFHGGITPIGPVSAACLCIIIQEATAAKMAC